MDLSTTDENMDAEEILKYLRDQIKNVEYEDQVINIKIVNKELQSTFKYVDQLKNCGNCEHPPHMRNTVCVTCTRGLQLVTRAEKRDNWIKFKNKS